MTTNNPRFNVHIPDHEVLRKIGGGAYGEVWMARGVTGALRAVKVVWREDFDDERGFEREFDGILKYEPISRDHPGLVNILHVGRSKEGQEAFYYYVMELGDDYVTGGDINPVEYEARTLRSDVVHAEGQPLPIDFCLDVALRLGDALECLHSHGLAHRDVKPSNVIFVDGKAKLADIGLVAPRDQRTFVGTEGFVPPEGPGSAQADLYSLGKVLYEMVSGKDRLQFPELPDELPSGDARKRWLALNQVLCDICEPRQSKRDIQTAHQFVEAIKRIQAGKNVLKRRSAFMARAALATIMLALAGVGIFSIVSEDDPSRDEPSSLPEVATIESEPTEIQYEFCSVRVTSQPQHAELYEDGIKVLGVTPTEFRDFEPGDTVTYRFEKMGFRSLEKTYTIPNAPTFLIFEELQVFRPPVEHLTWKGPFGVKYMPQIDVHQSGVLRQVYYRRFLKATGSDDLARYATFSENGEKIKIALLLPEQADAYIEWVEDKARAEGLIEARHMMDYKTDPDLKATGFTERDRLEGYLPIRCLVKQIPYASVELTSIPDGARVYLDGNFQGLTPIILSELRPREFELEIREDGFKKFSQAITLYDHENFQLNAVLEANHGVVFGEPWRNSLGMELKPINPRLMAGVHEVRVRDYLRFAKDTKRRLPSYAKDPEYLDHPIVDVSREDAIAYCQWLTENERQTDTISEGHVYNLPTDIQWSEMVGFEEDPELSPLERDLDAHSNMTLADLFFWGETFPPEESVINIADEMASMSVHTPKDRTIDGYNDGYSRTAPVGKFPANEFGLHDLGGNVSEWVLDDYDAESGLALVRGGSWSTFYQRHLRVWSRSVMPPSHKSMDIGFRVVLNDHNVSVEMEPEPFSEPLEGQTITE